MITQQYIEQISLLISEQHQDLQKKVIDLVKSSRSLFFIGNGGSLSACEHMAEDYSKVADIPSHSLSSCPFITCLGNDYGYENIFKEWLKRFFSKNDLLIAISSSGESQNIINGIVEAKNIGGKVVTLTAHRKDNSCSQLGNINIHIPTMSYGVAECTHQIILHVILDEVIQEKDGV